MGAADRDGERVDAGRGDERRRFSGVGAHAGSVGAVLAADLAEFGFQAQPVLRAPSPRRLCVAATFAS